MIMQMEQNTSGQGASSIVPDEIKGWNWGAFLLSWIWAIGNSVWIGLLWFVLGWIMSFILGIKGNEWAWQSRKWESVEQFKDVQNKWAIGALIYGFVFIVTPFVFFLCQN